MQFRPVLLAAVLSHLAPALAAPPIIVGYYPTWKHDVLSKLDLANYTHINVAFALPDEKANLAFEGEAMMPEIVPKLQAHNTKVLVSVGGWTGSAFFSNITRPEMSETFANNVIELMEKHNLDGIDFDWEYPGQAGSPCNFFDEQNDTKNFLAFLQKLRPKVDALGPGKLITLAVLTRPFAGPGGEDVSEFAKVVDFTNIMQYDMNGAWGTETGPNAPLNFEPGKATQRSFATAIEEWTSAGWPAGQLTSGLAFYGRSVTALVDMLAQNPVSQYANFSKEVPRGDNGDKLTAETCPPNSASNVNGTAAWSGTWTYANLRAQGVLATPTTASPPWVRTFDNITMTPWLFHPENKTYITYDDPVSLDAKIKFALSKGLAGAMAWEITGDFNGELVSAVRGALGTKKRRK
ncbi:chitinase [Metarhizium guizhouense ARSEF 977]|uniref:chitinase n=1 Tax=Metarhizium guizhouense (strain ARSEF 977) TaxID=1276136 RepID=A0A0B4GVG4_METGA|nr:chitinase [Metarhizium guizhouense ARSEF 977]